MVYAISFIVILLTTNRSKFGVIEATGATNFARWRWRWRWRWRCSSSSSSSSSSSASGVSTTAFPKSSPVSALSCSATLTKVLKGVLALTRISTTICINTSSVSATRPIAIIVDVCVVGRNPRRRAWNKAWWEKRWEIRWGNRGSSIRITRTPTDPVSSNRSYGKCVRSSV